MEKILTVSIAAYNVEEFIENTLKSVLVNNIDDLEVLVEDDGGTDGTADIVKKYEEKYPGIVKLVHKENGGYGSTINKSVELAQGKYFKQLDGDDWYESENFEKFLELLRTIDVDAIYTPHKEFREKSNGYKIKDYFPEDIEGEYNLEEVIDKKTDYMIMHTVAFKTEIIRKSNLNLPEHCLYTDSIFAMFTMMYVQNIYISHLPIYVYRIGRAEQSISVESHIKHYNDHVIVSKEIIKFYNEQCNKLENNKLKYLFDYAKMHIANSIVGFLLILKPSKENLKQLKDFDDYVKEENGALYEKMAEQSSVVRILRKTKYNFIVYAVLSKLKKIKIEKSQN